MAQERMTNPADGGAVRVATVLGRVAALAALGFGVGAFALGIQETSVPLIVVGITLAAMALLGFANIGLGRRPSRIGVASPRSPTQDEVLAMDPLVYRTEHLRRLTLAGGSTVVLAMFLFLYAWATYTGALHPAGLEFWIDSALLLGIVTAAVAFSMKLVLTDRFFQITDRGFWPRRVPLFRALRNKSFVSLDEVQDARRLRDPAGDAVIVLLTDGTTLILRPQDGIPVPAIERLWRIVEMRTRGSKSESPPGTNG